MIWTLFDKTVGMFNQNMHIFFKTMNILNSTSVGAVDHYTKKKSKMSYLTEFEVHY